MDQATGDVRVTNDGVTSIVAGTNISLNPTSGVGNVVINALNNPGTVQSAIPGNGLQLDSGTLTSNPTLGVEYDGSNNYILVGKNSGATPATVPTSNDYIAFNQLSSGNVKSSTFATIPASALPLVQQYIDTGDANTVKNNTDTYNTTAKVNKIVTLTDTEYAAIGTPDPNTLYIAILDANKCTPQTMTLNTTNNITGGSNYTLSGDTNGATYEGCEGEEFTFKTIATPDVGYYFSTPVTGLTVTGQITNPGGNANQTLAGVIALDPTFPITATLLVVTDIQGPGGDGSGFTLGGDITGATSSTTGTSHAYSFTTTCTANANYNFTSGPTITNASGTLNGSQTVVTTITGTLALT